MRYIFLDHKGQAHFDVEKIEAEKQRLEDERKRAIQAINFGYDLMLNEIMNEAKAEMRKARPELADHI